jgi:hypothetical protein
VEWNTTILPIFASKGGVIGVDVVDEMLEASNKIS